MKVCLLTFYLFLSCSCIAQDNGYVPVAAISHNKLLIDHYRETEASFKVYQKILIIQTEKQAENAAADSTFSNAQPKKYVVVTITDVERSEPGGTVTAIKISRNLQDSFHINNQASVHLSSLYSRWRW
jgi:hypothetical protein